MKQELTEKFDAIKSKIATKEREKSDKISALIKQQVEPLLKQAANLRTELTLEVDSEFKTELSEMYKERSELQDAIDSYKVAEAQNLWYPDGTIVYFWKYSGSAYSSNRKLIKTDKTGTVKVYDGTQELNGVSRYSLPKTGDIVVFHNRKDGSMGLKFDIISQYGEVKRHHERWLKEGETPENNIETQKANSIS